MELNHQIEKEEKNILDVISKVEESFNQFFDLIEVEAQYHVDRNDFEPGKEEDAEIEARAEGMIRRLFKLCRRTKMMEKWLITINSLKDELSCEVVPSVKTELADLIEWVVNLEPQINPWMELILQFQ